MIGFVSPLSGVHSSASALQQARSAAAESPGSDGGISFLPTQIYQAGVQNRLGEIG